MRQVCHFFQKMCYTEIFGEKWITNKIGAIKCQQGTSLGWGCLFTATWLIDARARSLRFFSQAVTEFGFGSVCLM